MLFPVHALMKNPDDDQYVLCLPIKNDVLANRMGAQAFVDIIAWRIQAGCVPDRFEGVFDLAQVFPLLGRPPLTPGIIPDLA